MTPSTRTRRRLFSLAMVALVALLVVAAVRNSPASVPTASATATSTVYVHSYRYEPQFVVPSDGTTHMQPGQSLTVRWLPHLQLTEGPARIYGAVALYGPCASRDAALHAVALPPGLGTTTTPVAVNAPLAYTAPWLLLIGHAYEPDSSTVTLPHSVTPGFYLLVALTTNDESPTYSYASVVLTIVGGAP